MADVDGAVALLNEVVGKLGTEVPVGELRAKVQQAVTLLSGVEKELHDKDAELDAAAQEVATLNDQVLAATKAAHAADSEE